MNPNKYFEFEYNGESYVVPRKWLEEHDKHIRDKTINEFVDKFLAQTQLRQMTKQKQNM